MRQSVPIISAYLEIRLRSQLEHFTESVSKRAHATSYRGVSLLVLLLLCHGDALAGEVTFPADCGVRNVRTEFGAKGDGVTDDTVAIQNAFDACQKKHMGTAYFPKGIYIVTRPVHFRGWVFVQGESRETTVIKLKDSCDGYGDPKKPNYLLATTDPMEPEKRPGGDNMAFSNHVLDLTLDTGKGNPAAIGVQFISHNGGGLERVTVRSGDGKGLIGLDLRTPWNGPCLFKSVRIEGFDTGVESRNQTYFSTFEDIELVGQNVIGWLNSDHPLAVRRLISKNAVPVIRNDTAEGHVVVLDGNFSGGNPQVSAIENDKGSLFARNVRTTGYASAIRHQGTAVDGVTVKEYVSGKAVSLHDSPARSLNLPVEETPELPWEPQGDWVSVLDYKPKTITFWATDHNETGYDAAEAVQKAIDSGKSTIYFPYGNYILNAPIVIRGKVRVLQGSGSILMCNRPAFKDKSASPVTLGTTIAKTVFLDRLSFPYFDRKEGDYYLRHDGAADLVVLHSRWLSYRNGPACGKLFVADMCGAPWLFEHPQKVFARSVNCESHEGMKIDNRAADLWLFGYKAEGTATEIRTGKKAQTELLGGLLYPAGGDLEKNPSFINDGGRVSLVHAMFWANRQYIHDTWDGTLRKHRTEERFMPLYVTNPGAK